MAVYTVAEIRTVLTPWIPADHECENLRANIEFPNCWDGKTLYDPAGKHVVHNHGDHACPKGYKRIPTLLMESECRASVSSLPNTPFEFVGGARLKADQKSIISLL
jgi:hypothetical protein